MGGHDDGRSALSRPARTTSVDAAQAAGLDRAAADLGVATDGLMAVAGFQCARLAHRIRAEAGGGPVAVLAGRGNNGGDALVAARHLAGWGVPVRLVLVGDPGRLAPPAAGHWAAARSGPLDAHWAVAGDGVGAAVDAALAGARVAVDGLLGTGGRGDPREPEATAIRCLNRARPPRVLSIDLPSGLDAGSGVPGDPCVTATDTAMLGAAKTGCLRAAAAGVTGVCWLADIGIPAAAFAAVGAAAPALADGEWVVIERP